MRTVVLKDSQIEKLLNRNFVCAWKNIEGESTCGGSYAHELKDKPGQCLTGDGEHNTQMCVYTSDGKLLDVLAGYQTPKDLYDELEWVFKTVRPIAESNLEDSARQERLSKLFTDKAGRTQHHSLAIDARFMAKHVLTSFSEFNAEELVSGRGFGDHFFGRFAKDMPGDALGKVPGYQQAQVDEKRLQEITAEAKKLKRQFNMAGEKERAEIKSKLAALENEYNDLKAKNAEFAKKVQVMAKK